MSYGDAMAQLRKEQSWTDKYEDDEEVGEVSNLAIAREVGGALAEGFRDRITFGTFDNCREWGLTFTAGDWTFCCFEHRNSDQICIEGCLTADMESYGPYGCEDKYSMMFEARYEEYEVITRALTYALDAALRGELVDRKLAIGLMNLALQATPR